MRLHNATTWVSLHTEQNVWPILRIRQS